jgi:hypothetical protein
MMHIAADWQRNNTISFLSCFVLLLAPVTSGQQQQESMPSVSGQVTDADSGSPLENAIVFLANTPIGTSSGTDGKFLLILTGVPPGEYDMVVSRVGYERKTLQIRVEKNKSLTYEVKLQPRPIRTREVEVLGERPGEAVAKLTYQFFPKDTSDIYALYGSSSSNPIGILYSDSAFYIYSLKTAIIDSEKYICLWLLYKNLSESPYDFDPMRCVRLHMRGMKRSYSNMPPAFPSRMVAIVNNDTAVAEGSREIGNLLRGWAVNQTSSTFVATIFEEWASSMKHPRIPHIHEKFGPSGGGSLSANLYSIFTTSVNVGILRRYKIYPENSVNGYVYFPFPGLNWKASDSHFLEATEFVYQIDIVTPTGIRTIEFVPG